MSEKLGIDIRPVTEQEKSNKSFKLNFYADEEELPSVDHMELTPSSSSFSFGFRTDEVDDATSSAPSSYILEGSSQERTGKESIITYNNRIEREENESKLRKPVPLQDVIAACKLFSRKESEEDFKEHWKLQREKLVTDYKRKKRDSKRRTKYHGKNVDVETEKGLSSNKRDWSPRFHKRQGSGGRKKNQRKS